MIEPKPSLAFYFSFRSPYAWLAFYRISKLAGRLPVNIDFIPMYPKPQLPGDPAPNPDKFKYMREDVGRFAKTYGLTLQWPESLDTDWARPHASFLYALDQGCAVEFGMAAFSARFSRGEDIGQNDTLAAIAEQSGLPADAVINSADDASLQQRMHKTMLRARRQGVFGVPFFVYGEHHFWGNDRIEWLLQELSSTHLLAPN
jgi:2-hydroxychromene-2-carboxylate isomerase